MSSESYRRGYQDAIKEAEKVLVRSIKRSKDIAELYTDMSIFLHDERLRSRKPEECTGIHVSDVVSSIIKGGE